MNISRLNPWNWFKKEEQQEKTVPVQQEGTTEQNLTPRDRLHHEIDRLFENVFRGFPARDPLRGFMSDAPGASGIASFLKPRLDVGGSDKEYTISVELPGVDEKDFMLELRDDCLIIRGEKRHEHEDKGKGYYRMERSYGSFQRVLSLPEDSATEDIKATFKKGVLNISVPRREQPASSVKQIEISQG